MGKQLRYLEIAQIIKDRIRNGSLKNGEALPSQKELSEIFSTSIMTARQALGVLEQEGIISVVHGVGTFVSAPEFHSGNIGLQGFQNEMDRQKLKIQTVILEKKFNVSYKDLSGIFQTEDGGFSCLIRLRMLEDRPIILQRSWVPAEYRAVIEEYSEDKSLYRFFTERTNKMIIKGREIVTPVLLKDKELELLKLEPGCTAFHSSRVSISLDDKIVLYDEAYMPGPYVVMASMKQGRNNSFKYIINKDGSQKPFDNFNDPELWEDLL